MCWFILHVISASVYGTPLLTVGPAPTLRLAPRLIIIAPTDLLSLIIMCAPKVAKPYVAALSICGRTFIWGVFYFLAPISRCPPYLELLVVFCLRLKFFYAHLENPLATQDRSQQPRTRFVRGRKFRFSGLRQSEQISSNLLSFFFCC